jgi:hypothetical protein
MVDDEFKFIKRAEIRPEHQGPGSTEKTLIDDSGAHRFNRFVRLEIARNGVSGGYYLFHISADGSGTDTWHATIEDAFGRAEEEYGVRRDEWRDIT